jgi:hypothetical protein
MWTLYSVVHREGGVTVQKEMQTCFGSYLSSADLHMQVRLSTRHCGKHFASQADVQKLVDAYYMDIQHYRTNWMHLQMSALTMLLSISAECIGVLVESNCYCGSNECLKWRDIKVMVFPGNDVLPKLIIGMKVTACLLKSGCDVKSFFRTFFLFPECGVNHPYCHVMPLLALGLLDQVWEGISGPAQR